jgi:hypothetical protein
MHSESAIGLFWDIESLGVPVYAKPNQIISLLIRIASSYSSSRSIDLARIYGSRKGLSHDALQAIDLSNIEVFYFSYLHFRNIVLIQAEFSRSERIMTK